MDFNRYCTHCGEKVEFEYGEIITICPSCKNKIKKEDSISGFTKDARVNQLKAMHKLMCLANNESIYYNNWIYLMPDEPSEDDFVSIAIDDDQYNECFDLFVKLIAKDGNRY
jgi:hypothetical protein